MSWQKGFGRTLGSSCAQSGEALGGAKALEEDPRAALSGVEREKHDGAVCTCHAMLRLTRFWPMAFVSARLMCCRCQVSMSM